MHSEPVKLNFYNKSARVKTKWNFYDIKYFYHYYIAIRLTKYYNIVYLTFQARTASVSQVFVRSFLAIRIVIRFHDFLTLRYFIARYIYFINQRDPITKSVYSSVRVLVRDPVPQYRNFRSVYLNKVAKLKRLQERLFFYIFCPILTDLLNPNASTELIVCKSISHWAVFVIFPYCKFTPLILLLYFLNQLHPKLNHLFTNKINVSKFKKSTGIKVLHQNIISKLR